MGRQKLWPEKDGDLEGFYLICSMVVLGSSAAFMLVCYYVNVSNWPMVQAVGLAALVAGFLRYLRTGRSLQRARGRRIS